MTRRLLTTDSDWSFETIEAFDWEIGRIAEGYGLDTYANQIEIIRSDQMMDAYASVGMPLGYNHWSYGKQFINVERGYRRGQMGLAYELVINSDPCISYLMEENTMTLQALVIAHACYGHNSFFKGNYLFKTWTDAGSIIDYLLFAKNYIAHCEERYGVDEVEQLLDSCHALMNYGTDRYKRPNPISAREEMERQQEREEYLQRQVNDLWRTIPGDRRQDDDTETGRFPEDPQENLLYFIEKNAPLLEPWQREVVRIVRKMAQYFYPQRQTKVMNEGWACFWHYRLLNDLYDEGLVSDGFMLEFLQSHTNVVAQPPYHSQYYSGINPYALGFAMMQDIKRICESPTDEDKAWFSEFAGSDWNQTLHFAMENFKDESFVQQFLSPRVIRDLKLFSIRDDSSEDELEVSAIHDEVGYHAVRESVARHYNLSVQEPDIQICNVDIRGDRSLTLHHVQDSQQRPLDEEADEVLRHLRRLWGFDVYLHSLHNDRVVKTYSCVAH